MAGINNQQREAIKAVYPSTKWALKVDKMDDSTVTAIYLRLKAQGKVS